MKKFLFLSLILLFSVFLYNSCEKAQNIKSPVTDQEFPGTANKGESSKEVVLGTADLTIDAARLQSSMVIRTKVFKAGDCALVEACVNGSGKRKLLRFDVATPNIGNADLILGNPANNSLFVYSPCHGHYHFSDYANYDLLNANGSSVVAGHKQAFCLEDFSRYDPAAGPAKYTCSNQGISVGWQDVYGSYLDCQWIDITDIQPGNYQLRVTINPLGKLTESTLTNNVATVPVKIPK